MFFESWFLDYRGACATRYTTVRFSAWRGERGIAMKAISRMLVFAVLVASVSGCATGTGFRPGAGERVLDTTLKGVAVGAVGGVAVGVLSEVFNGGDRGQDVVVAPGGYGHGGGHDGWGHGGYNSPAEAVNARRYRAMQRDEEARRQEAIWAERYGYRRR